MDPVLRFHLQLAVTPGLSISDTVDPDEASFVRHRLNRSQPTDIR